MDFNEYQEAALKTAIYPKEQTLSYCALGLASEAGEVAGKVKKVIRDKGGILSPDDRMAIAAEISDVMWYIANLAEYLAIPMETMAEANILKLRSRQERGTLSGSGDDR